MHRIKMDLSNIICGVMFTLAGFTIALSINTPLEAISKWPDFISAVGTIIAAIIGAIALNTWRHQFEHEEKYKAIVKLEVSFREWFRAFHNYRYARLKDMRDKRSSIEGTWKLDEYKLLEKAQANYLESWSYATPFLSKSVVEKFEFEPQKAFRSAIPILQSEDNFEFEITKIWDHGIKAIRKLRSA